MRVRMWKRGFAALTLGDVLCGCVIMEWENATGDKERERERVRTKTCLRVVIMRVNGAGERVSIEDGSQMSVAARWYWRVGQREQVTFISVITIKSNMFIARAGI